jgi:hypothetical protein
MGNKLRATQGAGDCADDFEAKKARLFFDFLLKGSRHL